MVQCYVIVPVIATVQGDNHQRHTVTLRRGHQTSTGFTGETRFETDATIHQF